MGDLATDRPLLVCASENDLLVGHLRLERIAVRVPLDVIIMCDDRKRLPRWTLPCDAHVKS